jgi:hypothetical protein
MLGRNWLCAAVALPLLATLSLSATLPRKANDIKIEMAGAPAIQLSQYKGKAVVLAFILTTCPHCQNTTGLLTAMQREYGPRGLQVVVAAVEEGANKNVGQFARQLGANFPVGFISVPNQMQWVDFMQHPTMQVPRMPMLAFIDRNGMVRSQHDATDDKFFGNEPQNMKAEIETILGGAGAPAKSAPKKSPAKPAAK